MKFFQKKYKTKLYFTQRRTYHYILPSMFIFILITLLFIFDTKVLLTLFSLTIPSRVYFTLLSSLLLTSLFAWYISPFSFSKNIRIKHVLKRIIEHNNFYHAYGSQKIVHSSMLIKHYWLDEQLVLEVYSFGAKYSSKLDQLSKIFETAFNLTVVSVQNDFPDHTTYLLSSSLAKPLVIDENWVNSNE